MLSHSDALLAQRVIRHLNDRWEFSPVINENYFPAQVLGNIHLDLHKNGQITHPFMGTTEYQIHWIAEHDWKYGLKIPVDKELFEKNNI